jgi:hypothetical protein
MINEYKTLVGEHERRSSYRDFKETGCEDVGWFYLAQCRIQWQALVNIVMNT